MYQSATEFMCWSGWLPTTWSTNMMLAGGLKRERERNCLRFEGLNLCDIWLASFVRCIVHWEGASINVVVSSSQHFQYRVSGSGHLIAREEVLVTVVAPLNKGMGGIAILYGGTPDDDLCIVIWT